MYITREKESEMGNVAAENNNKNKKTTMTFRQAHDQLGHMSYATTRETAKRLGLQITKTQILPCAACAAGKAKQKNIKRTETTKQKIGQRRAYLDIATIKKRQGMPIPSKPNWRIIVVDQRIQIKFSKFFKTKDAMVEPTCEQLHKWQQSNIGITHLRLDNAGENKLLQTRCSSKDWKMKCEFEFTARDTPQQNSLAEVGFATLANRGRAMMHRANLPMMDRYRLAHEAFQCATHLDGLTVVEINGVRKTRYEHFVGQNPMFAKHLRTWGEAGTVKIKTSTSPKLNDKGTHCMFVGYTYNHPGDCYRMYDPKTGRTRETRDVIWLKRMFYQRPPNQRELTTESLTYDVTQEQNQDQDQDQDQTNNQAITTQNDVTMDDATSIEDGEGQSNNDDQTEQSNHDEQESAQGDAEETHQQPNETTTTSSGRAVQRPAWMDEYEMGMTAAEIKYYEAMKELGCCTDDPEQQQHELGLVGAGLGEGIANTRELKVLSYDEAMERPDKEKWDKSVEEEHKRMKDNGVFDAVPMTQVPIDADVIDSTWAMKKKASGVYRARLAARGFKQRAGVSFDPRDIMSPVVHEITVRIMLVLMVMALWHAEIIDVKGAFLKASFDPKHKVYMEIPKGFQKFYPKNVLLLLKKILYGVKNAAKAFWLVLLKIMASIGLLRSKARSMPLLHLACGIRPDYNFVLD